MSTRAERVLAAAWFGSSTSAENVAGIVVETLRAMAELGGSWSTDDLRALADEVEVVALPPMTPILSGERLDAALSSDEPIHARLTATPPATSNADMTAQQAYDILRAAIDAQSEHLRAYEALYLLWIRACEAPRDYRDWYRKHGAVPARIVEHSVTDGGIHCLREGPHPESSCTKAGDDDA